MQTHVYTPFTLSSGLAVEIRSRTYEEWEKQEEERLALLESVPNIAKEGNMQDLELALQKAALSVRNGRLALWVNSFEGMKSQLTLREIAEIEKKALELEELEVPLGNSEPGGSGQ